MLCSLVVRVNVVYTGNEEDPESDTGCNGYKEYVGFNGAFNFASGAEDTTTRRDHSQQSDRHEYCRHRRQYELEVHEVGNSSYVRAFSYCVVHIPEVIGVERAPDTNDRAEQS